MLYNVQTQIEAQNTLNIIGLQRESKITSPDFARIEDSFKDWKILLSHITTSTNNCKSVKENGLFGFSGALNCDSEFAKILEIAQIVYKDGVFYCKASDGTCAPIVSDFLCGISREDCVNAFLFHADQMDEYDRSPDVLRKIAHSGNIKMQNILKKWEREAKPYEVSFCVSPFDIDVVTGYYASNEDAIGELFHALCDICLDIANGRLPFHYSLPVALKPQVSISPSELNIKLLR